MVTIIIMFAAAGASLPQDPPWRHRRPLWRVPHTYARTLRVPSKTTHLRVMCFRWWLFPNFPVAWQEHDSQALWTVFISFRSTLNFINFLMLHNVPPWGTETAAVSLAWISAAAVLPLCLHWPAAVRPAHSIHGQIRPLYNTREFDFARFRNKV